MGAFSHARGLHSEFLTSDTGKQSQPVPSTRLFQASKQSVLRRLHIHNKAAKEGDVVHVHYTVYPDRPAERERGFTRHAGAAVNFTLGSLKSRQLDLKAIERAVPGLDVGSKQMLELAPVDETRTHDCVFSMPKNDDQISYLQSRGRRGRALKQGAIVSLEDGSQVEVVDVTDVDVVFRALNAIAILHTGRAAVLEMQLVGIDD